MENKIYEETMKRYNNLKPNRNDLVNPTEEDLYMFYREKNILGVTALRWAELVRKGKSSII